MVKEDANQNRNIGLRSTSDHFWHEALMTGSV